MKDKVIGVIAEFNPFHNGHKYQIDTIIKEKPRLVIALISGDYVQRGEISFLTKEEKTILALENGYDIVVELPVYYSIQNADIFASSGTKILEYLNVDIQVFGIENESELELEEIIALQKDETYINSIKEYQKQGHSYIKSHELTLCKLNLKDKYKSNNILAISYMRNILENNMKMRFKGIKRKNVDYNSNESIKNIASATYIRNNMLNIENIKNFVPYNTFELISKKNFKNIDDEIFKLFKYVFNVKTKIEIIKVYDFNDIMYNRIKKYINNVSGYNEFLKIINARNISINRVKRIMLNTLLDIREEDVSISDDVRYVRILGINKKGAKYIKELEKDNIFVNWKDVERNFDTRIEKNAFILTEILLNKKEKLNSLYKGG